MITELRKIAVPTQQGTKRMVNPVVVACYDSCNNYVYSRFRGLAIGLIVACGRERYDDGKSDQRRSEGKRTKSAPL